MRKEFIWKGVPFVGILQKDKTGKKIWKKEGSELRFITTGLPAPDQIVVFKKFEDEFVFFTHFKDLGEVWEVGFPGRLSHYSPLLPYQPFALLKPYLVDNGFQQTVLVEFFESEKCEKFWRFRRSAQCPWVKT